MIRICHHRFTLQEGSPLLQPPARGARSCGVPDFLRSSPARSHWPPSPYGAGIQAQSQDEPPNLLPNGDFEQGAVGWTAPVGTLELVTDPVQDGKFAGRVTAQKAEPSRC